MVLLHSLDALREWQQKSNWSGKSTGFVPTMGALHNGHASLIRTAAAQCDLVVVSILVNPTQFNESSDFESYPRTLESDAQKAQAAGADAVFAPSAEDLYGGTPQAPAVDWGALTSAYEGAHGQVILTAWWRWWTCCFKRCSQPWRCLAKKICNRSG